MNGKITLALVAAAAVAVGYLVWFDRDRPGTQVAALAERRLLPPGQAGRVAAPIDRLEIIGEDGAATIVLALGEDREWRMLAPKVDRADAGALRELVEALETSFRFDTIPVAASDLEKYGLRQPGIRLRIFRGRAEPVELRFGGPTAVEGKRYAMVAGSAEVLVVPDLIRQLARRPVQDYRDGQLSPIRPVDIARVTLRNGSGEIELQRDRGRWEMVRPVAARADDQAVNDWLERLSASGVRQFLDDDIGSLLSYGLAAPRGEIRLEFESTTDEGVPPVEIFFGHRADPRYAPDCVYVSVPGRGIVAAVPMGIEEALLLEADALREKTLLSLNPDLVDRVHLRPAEGAELVLARRGDDWTMLQPVAMEVEATEAMRMLKRLPETRVRTFLDDAAARAAAGELDPPRLRVTLASFLSENNAESAAGETPIATLSFGPARADGSVLVRVESEGTSLVARVDAGVLSLVPTDPIAWRRLRLFGETPLSVETLAVERGGVTREFRREGSFWRPAVTGTSIASATIESATALVAGLRAVRWVGPVVAAHGLDTPGLIVRARPAAGGEIIELRIGRRTSEGLWPATLAGRGGVFLLSDPDYQVLAALAP